MHRRAMMRLDQKASTITSMNLVKAIERLVLFGCIELQSEQWTTIKDHAFSINTSSR